MIENRKESLNSRVRIHDKHHVEVKLDFELENVRESSYSVEMYFFIPRSLNVGPHNYHKEKFYDSCQRYIRFSTPKISLSRLCDPALEYSPISRIRKAIKQIQAGDNSSEIIEKVCCEIKLLGCIVRGEIRDCIGFFSEEFSRNDVNKFLISDGLDVFFNDWNNLKKNIIALRAEVLLPTIPVKIRESFAFCDEYISLVVEEYLNTLVSVLRKNPALSEYLKKQEEQALRIVREENDYRRNMKYISVFQKDSLNEAFVYHRGVLKKYISAVLFIRAEFSEWQAVTQIVFAFAAGVAMLFASVISVYFQNLYTTTSVPFIAALVISYIFKDRIKDWVKIAFSKKLTHWISDRKIDVIDPVTYKCIGVLKEAFTFIKHEDLPEEVERLRSIDYATSIESEGRPERVFKYKKKITFYPHKIVKHHSRRKGINDIVRFNLERFMLQADDPVTEYRYYDENDNTVKTASCSRVYHINIITKCASVNAEGIEKNIYERRKIIMNKSGIVRMEEVK